MKGKRKSVNPCLKGLQMQLKKMGLVFFMTLLVTTVMANGFTRVKLSLVMNNADVREVFQAIEEKTDYIFLYKDQIFDFSKKITINVSNAGFDEVMKAVCQQTGVDYEVRENQIILKEKEKIQVPAGMQQQKTIRGTVTDQSGQPLPGVSVVVKGTTTGITTDANGNFSLTVPSADAVLSVSFVGMNPQEVLVGNQTSVNIMLEEANIGIEEVIAIGYGTVKKSDVTGALTSVTEKTIKERPLQNAVQAMQGKAAGVDIVSNVRPGEVASINIRGTRSINGSNSPLFVVDGIIMMGSVNDINPNDIASMEILKDASATAIYGSRGANGVVLVTTKSGRKGNVTVNYDASLSVDNIRSLTDWASAGEALDRYRAASVNGGTYKSGSTALLYPDPAADIQMFGNSDPMTIAAIRAGYDWNDPGTFASIKTRTATAEEIAKGWPQQVPVYNAANIPTTDWIDLLTKPSNTQNHLISLTAGTPVSKLYMSAGYLSNDGTQKNQSYKRYTVRMNGDITPYKWLTVGTSLSIARTSQEYGTINRTGSATGPKDSYGTALSQYLMASPYDTEGKLVEFPGNNSTAPVWNPLIDIDEAEDSRMATNINGNVYTEIKFTPWLKYRMNFGSGIRNTHNATFQSSNSTLLRKASPPTSTASYSTSEVFQYMIENLLYFDKSYEDHNFGALLMQSAQKYQSESSNIGSSKILYNAARWYNLSSNLNGKPDSYGTGFSESSMQSYMARINYGFRDKYLLTATGRWDGSSVLATGHKWDFFPSFALAWKAHQENFLKPVSVINELKFRLGYGVTGNSGVGSYTTMGPLTAYNYVFGTSPAIGYIPYMMANPGLGWEKTAQWNAGIDFGILKNRISGTVELYKSNTYDILMTRDIPVVTGYSSIWYNIGKMKNTGIEISLSTINIDKGGFRWVTDLNWSANKEEIVELVNGKQDMKSNGWFIGQPLQVFRNYKVNGLWQDTPDDQAEIAKWLANGYTFTPGQYKPVEQGTPDYKLTDDDMVIRGTDRPKWVSGMTNTWSYKNFELSCFVYARIGQSYFSSLQPGGSSGGSFVGYVRRADLSEFWSSDNPDARWPKLTTAAKQSVTAVNQAMYINDGSFVAVRNIGLAYNVPSGLLAKFHIRNLQVYSQLLNPFLFGGDVVKAGINPDDTNGWTSVNSVGDPTGGTNNNTMIVKSMVFGIRVGF